MKTSKHILTTALLFASAASFAQSTTITITTDSTGATTKPIKHAERVRTDLNSYLGFNGFSGALPAGYDFRPVGSRFIALAWQTRIPLAVSGTTKLRLLTGPEVAWNNFMFEGRNTLVAQSGQLVVEPATVDLRKSKLVMAQLNLPLMLNLSFKSGFSLSMGGYAGMRLDSYTKVKPEGGSAARTHSTYNLNPVRWGYMAELGYRGHAKLFGRYEPNSPFRAGQGPDAGIWTVGIKL
jgi:hypothetical protein